MPSDAPRSPRSGNAKLNGSNLSAALGQPQVGRRETPLQPSEDKRAVRRRVLLGLGLSAIVVVAVVALIMVLAPGAVVG